MGAYVLCEAGLYAITRILLFALSAGLFAVRIWEMVSKDTTTTTTFIHTDPFFAKSHTTNNLRFWDFFLYFENWVLLVSLCYFLCAGIITLFAVCLPGAESPRAPWFVWITWILHAALLPMTLVNAFAWLLVTEGRGAIGHSNSMIVDATCVYGSFIIVFFDAWINRQPYYASFHGFIGFGTCITYLVFNILYTVLGGEDENGFNTIYPGTHWVKTDRQHWMTVGKLTYLECMILIPMANLLYWCMLWARRRARVAAKQSAV